MKIVLTEIEVNLANLMSDVMQQFAVNNNYQKRRIDGRTDYELMRHGAGAELAVARVLNVYPDFTSDYSKVDLTWRGQTINVKQTKYQKGRLLIPEYQGKTAEWYILVTGELPEYTIRGVAHTDLVFGREAEWFYKARSHVIEQDELTSMEDWIYAITEASRKGD